MEMLIGGTGLSQQITSPTYKRGNLNSFLHQGRAGLAIATVITRMFLFGTRKRAERNRFRTMCYRAIVHHHASAFGHVGAIPFAWGPGAMQVRKGPARQRGSWASTVKLMQLFAR